MSDKREMIIHNVFDELRRAEELHPGWPADIFERLAIIGEEFGELQQATLQAKYEQGDPRAIYTEAVQLSAMTLRFLFNLGNNQ